MSPYVVSGGHFFVRRGGLDFFNAIENSVISIQKIDIYNKKLKKSDCILDQFNVMCHQKLFENTSILFSIRFRFEILQIMSFCDFCSK